MICHRQFNLWGWHIFSKFVIDNIYSKGYVSILGLFYVLLFGTIQGTLYNEAECAMIV